MIYLNKCALEKEQIKAAVKDGFKYLEFHTSLKHYEYTLEEIMEIRKLLDENNITCVAIHLPIESNDYNADYISIPAINKEYRDKFMEISKKAIDYISILSNAEKPIIVSHIGTSYYYNDMETRLSDDTIKEKLEEAKVDLIKISDYIYETDSSIIFTVENMPHFIETRRGMVAWQFGKDSEVNDFIKDINRANIKSCLDICHAESTIRILNLINNNYNLKIEDYIKNFKDTLAHIHLNNTENIGSRKDVHSTPFRDNKTSIEYLDRIIKAIVDNNIQCSITLEINEDDYTLRNNIKETKLVLNKVLKNNNLDEI